MCGVTAWAGRFRRVGDLSKFDQLWLQLRGWILVYFILLHLCLPLVGYHYLLVGQGTGEHHNDISPIWVQSSETHVLINSLTNTHKLGGEKYLQLDGCIWWMVAVNGWLSRWLMWVYFDGYFDVLSFEVSLKFKTRFNNGLQVNKVNQVNKVKDGSFCSRCLRFCRAGRCFQNDLRSWK